MCLESQGRLQSQILSKVGTVGTSREEIRIVFNIHGIGRLGRMISLLLCLFEN